MIVADFKHMIFVLTGAALSAAVGMLEPGAAGAQTATDLKCKGCVGTSDLGQQSVRSKNIRDRQVKPRDLSYAAKPSAVAASERLGSDNVAFFADRVVQTATIAAPGPGAVIAHYNAVVFSSGAGQRVACAATTGTTTTGQMLSEGVIGTGATARLTLSGTKTFKRAAPGKVKVNLVCRTFTTYTIRVQYPTLTLVFVPGAQTIATTADAAESGGSSGGSSGGLVD